MDMNIYTDSEGFIYYNELLYYFYRHYMYEHNGLD